MKIATLFILLFASLLVLPSPVAAAADEPEGYRVLMSSRLGGQGDADAVVGTAIQSDGSVVIAANLTPGATFGKAAVNFAGGSANGAVGVVARLSADGATLQSMQVIAAPVHDLAIDGQDRVYVAAGDTGIGRLDAKVTQSELMYKAQGPVERIDVAADGTVAAFVGGKANRIVVIAPDKKLLSDTPGKSLTQDVCIDGKSKTIIFTGFRNARAFDGKKTYPVQVAYLKGIGYDGQDKWWDYGWTTDKDKPDFLNRPENNMADTRGYRCSIGGDGKLYAAFEAAGGNHIFRYSPHDIMKKSEAMVGGDQYHQFHNSRAEHKTIFGRFDPATGEALKLIQLAGRLSDGKANAVRVKNGGITADAQGRVYLGGAAAYGLPMSWMPEGTGDYTGGAFLLVMSPDFTKRLLTTRLTPGGTTAAVAVREVGGKVRIALGGGDVKPETPFYEVEPLEDEPRGVDGYVAVMEGE